MALHLTPLLRQVRRSLGAAVGFTLVQQAGYFASAALLSAAFGAAAFGVYGQALALATIVGTAASARLELAGQLAPRERRANELFRLSTVVALGGGGALTLLCALAWVIADAPGWSIAAALAVAPLASVQIEAARAVRHQQVVRASACRALPAAAMLVVQAVAAWHGDAAWALASLPLGCGVAALGARWLSGAGLGAVHGPPRRASRLWRTRWPLVRAELPALLLNAAANHGQVLLVGALASDVDAGRYSLAQRISQAPTSLLGPAIGDWLRGRVIAAPASAATRARVGRALRWVTALSVVVHLGLAAATPWLVRRAFPAQGPVLVTLVSVLLIVGALRLVVSPLTFVLPLRGLYGRNLLGQVALCAVAVLSVLLGLQAGGDLVQVAVLYTLSSLAVYGLYLRWSVRALDRARVERPGRR